MRRVVSFCLLALSFVPVTAVAQTKLSADASVHGSPGGPSIGTLKRGATVRAGRASGPWTAVTVEGWIASYRLANRSDTLDRTVTGRGAVPVRISDGTSQPLAAELEPGTILKRMTERNGWTMVRRAAWVRSSALQVASGQGAGSPGGVSQGAGSPGPSNNADPPAQRAAAANPDAAQRAMRATSVRAAPGGDERATLRPGAAVQTIARSGGWALVRLEGWVPERDLTVGDSAGEAHLTAADLRANPAAHRGKIVRWDVQIISLQRADILRKGLEVDEPYLIARAPGADGAILYLAVPQSLFEQARALPQLARVLITARVRNGRSEPVGVPILELTALTKLP